MTETERKKVEWLHRYQGLLAMMEELEDEQEALRTKLEGLGAQLIDDMPKGFGGDPDKEKLIMRLEDNDKWLTKTWIEAEKERRKIYEAVNGIDDPAAQVLLLYRYIDGKDWKEVAEKMFYSERQVYYLHKRALALITA